MRRPHICMCAHAHTHRYKNSIHQGVKHENTWLFYSFLHYYKQIHFFLTILISCFEQRLLCVIYAGRWLFGVKIWPCIFWCDMIFPTAAALTEVSMRAVSFFMYMCVYARYIRCICMYVYMCVRMCVYVFVFMRVLGHTYACASIFTCHDFRFDKTHAHTHARTIYIYTHTLYDIHIQASAYIHTYIHTYIHMRICTATCTRHAFRFSATSLSRTHCSSMCRSCCSLRPGRPLHDFMCATCLITELPQRKTCLLNHAYVVALRK
jgi:hypothetical protein